MRASKVADKLPPGSQDATTLGPGGVGGSGLPAPTRLTSRGEARRRCRVPRTLRGGSSSARTTAPALSAFRDLEWVGAVHVCGRWFTGRVTRADPPVPAPPAGPDPVGGPAPAAAPDPAGAPDRAGAPDP